MQSSGAGWPFQVMSVCVFASSVVFCGESGAAWCYHDPSCNDRTWSKLSLNFCSGSRQSPIHIRSASVRPDPALTPFTFTNFINRDALREIHNTGRTVKVTLASGVVVSGGGLSEPYHSLQFHLHWGKGRLPGSEHAVDWKRYPMELHIVSVKASHKGNTKSAVNDPTGLAALGFFIDEGYSGEPNKPDAWHTLSSYLTRIEKSGTSVPLLPGVSLYDLLVGVDLTKYYRYLGSLTTPDCNKAVVWTVFKEPIKISRNLIDLFSSTVYITGSNTIHLVNNFRSLQPDLPVTSQPQTSTSHIKGIKG